MAYGPQPYIPVKPIVKRGYFEPPILGVPPAPGTVPAPGFAQIQGLVQQPITGQLPLTRSLPQGAGVTMRELPYELPTMRAVPSSIPVGAGQGTSAQALSGLYDAPINPQISRTIRGNWATPEFTPSASTSNVGSLMRGPAGPSGLPSVYEGLPAPPTSTLPPPPGAASSYSARTSATTPTPGVNPANVGGNFPAPPTAAAAEGQSLAQMGRGALSGMTGSFWPGATGLKGVGANALAVMGIQYGGDALTNALGGQNTTAGRLAGAGTIGTGLGALGGPKTALALGATNVSMQAGAEKRRVAEEKGLGGLVSQMTQPKSFGDIPGAAFDAATLPFSAPLQAIGAATGGPLGSLPFVGDFFGGGGGGENNAQAQAQQQGQQAAPLGPETIVDTAAKMGVGPQYVQALIDNANAEIAYQMASPTITPDTTTPDGQALVKQLEAAGIKADKSGAYTLPEEVIRATAYQNALSQLPVLRQQEQTNQDFARRTAALQAEIASRLGEWTQGMSPEMATALTTQAMSYPQYMAMQQQSDTNRQIAAQIQNALIQQQLATQLPGLFGQQQSGQSDLSTLLDPGS